MRRKNITSDMMKEYIITALLFLMKKDDFSKITIGEITDKAGVNRSTYYRNFCSKEDIIHTFFCNILKQSIASLSEPEKNNYVQYLTHIFEKFYEHKEEILIIHKNQLSYLLLPALNQSFLKNTEAMNNDFQESIPVYYHTGGIFNDFILWFEHGMKPIPKAFAKIISEICLPNSRTMLLK